MATLRVRLRAVRLQARGMSKTLVICALTALGDGRVVAADVALRIVRVIVLLALWRAVVRPGTVASGFTLPALLTYTLIGQVFAEPLNTGTEFTGWLWEGTIANKMLCPVTLVGQAIAQTAGGWVFSLLAVSLPILALSPLVGVDPLAASASAAVLFLVSLLMSVVVGLAIDFATGILVVAYGMTPWLVDHLRGAVAVILSGTVLPLAVLPWGLGTVLQWLPYASMGSAPLLIYTGTGDVPVLLATQAGWAVLLWLGTAWLWRKSQDALVSYGG